MPDAPLPSLLEAKSHSDKKKYHMKHRIIADMMRRNPDAFVIDSDDGKGIVGVTHVDTGFRLHMPRQVLPVPLSKAAGIGDVWNNIKRIKALPGATRSKFLGGQVQKHMMGTLNGAVDYIKNNPRVADAAQRISDYRIMDPANRGFHMRLGGGVGSGAGALTGAVAGAATGDDGESRVRNGLIGALTGAGAGAGAGVAAGRYLPRGLQIGAGRVLTNLVDPHIYDSKLHIGSVVDGVRRAGLKGALSAVWNDKPIHEIAPARHALFRDFFGLKRFKGTENVFKDVGTDANGLRTLRHNVRDAGARADLRDIHSARLKTLTDDGGTPGWHKWMQQGKLTPTSGGSPGNFGVKPDGTWEDVWDFGLHKGQKIDSTEKLLRGLVSPFGTPSKVVGKTLNESQMLRLSPMTPHRFGKIHPSFTEPVINRATRGAGLDSKELRNFMKAQIQGGQSGAVMKSMANRASGKPYNLLQDLAQSENTSNSDMREFLGGAPRVARQSLDRAPKWDPGDLKAMFAKRIEGANPNEVSNAIDQLSPVQHKALQNGLKQWAAQGRPAGGERDILAKVLGFAPDELPVLLG